MNRTVRKLGTILAVFSFLSGACLAQDYSKTKWYKLIHSEHPNYFEVTDAFDAYCREHQNDNVDEKSKEYIEYIRWIQKVGGNYDAEGNLLKVKDDLRDIEIVANSLKLKSTGNNANWEKIGPLSFDDEAHYRDNTQGVVRAIQQDPNDATKIFLGCISGGVWRSTNNGDNWTNVTKDLMVSTVAGICIAPANSNVVYANANEGVIKSTDGGTTWNFTGLDYSASYPDGPGATAIAIAHDNENKVMAAYKTGLWVTTNGGTTWTQKFTTHVYDVEFHPTNSNIAYATVDTGSGWTKFYKTTDSGATWTSITNGYPQPVSGDDMRRSLIEVSPAAPDNVWVVAGGTVNGGMGTYGVFKSTDKGVSFTNLYQAAPGVSGKPNILARATNGIEDGVGQLSWDMIFAVSDVNPDYMIAGTINVWKSVDGGVSWKYMNRTPMGGVHYHMDIQSAEIYDKNTWFGTDGGIMLSTDELATYQDKSFGGFAAQQVWGMDRSWKNDIMNAGFYHGQIVFRNDNMFVGGWYNVAGADASSTYINYGDDRYMYGNSYGGRLIIQSEDRFTPAAYILLPEHTPKGYFQNEMCNHFYYGQNFTYADNLFKQSADTEGLSKWSVLYTFGNKLTYIHPTYADGSIIYVVEKNNKIWRTDDGGISWENRTPPTTLTHGYSIGNVVSDGTDANIIWCSIQGKQSVVKVLKSTDGGINWVDYSGSNGNLPSYGINVIAHQLGTNGGLYIGNSAGIWYRNNSMNEWVNFSAGLPAATEISHIRFKYSEGKITIGSQRSIWESDVYENSKPIAHPIIEQRINEKGEVKFVDHSVCSSDATFNWSFQGGSPSTSTDANPVINYDQAGEYDVSLTVSDQNGSSSQTFPKFVEITLESLTPNLEAAYDFEGNANDITGNGWDASESGITFINDVERGVVADFNDTYSTITDHPGFVGASARTISAWIKTITPDKAIFACGAKAPTNKWSFRLYSNGKLRVEVEGGYIYGSTILTDGQWHHVACTFEDDGTPDVTDVKLYVDGQLETIEAQSSQTVNTARSSSVWIGKDFAADRNFVGQIDDFHIWDKALSNSEIAQQYNLTTDIEEIIEDNIQLAWDHLNVYIKNQGNNTIIKFFNLNGVCLHTIDMPVGRKTIRFDKPGLYIAAIYCEESIQTKKILLVN